MGCNARKTNKQTCGVGKLKRDGGGGDDLHILMVVAVILKKESQTSDKLLYPSGEFVEGEESLAVKNICFAMCLELQIKR
jgi:hypothetical protein